jgi:hypothetical protein
MKRLVLLTSLISLVFLLTNCSKDSPAPVVAKVNPHPIVGLWIGLSQVDGQPQLGSAYYSFDIRSDDSILVQGQGASDGLTYYGAGTWSISGTTFTATSHILNLGQTGVVQTVTAKYDSTAGTLSAGTWQNNSSTSGTFVLQRVN